MVGRLEPKWGGMVGLVASGAGPRPEVQVVTRGAASRVLAVGKGPAEPETPANDQQIEQWLREWDLWGLVPPELRRHAH